MLGPVGVALLGQSGGGDGVGRVVVLLLVLVVACVLLGLVLMRVRKHFFGDEDDGGPGLMPVAELRRLRDSGELTEEEFRRAIDAMAGRAKADGRGRSAGSAVPRATGDVGGGGDAAGGAEVPPDPGGR